jgi:transcriptional regulator with XRE-family HTH domain
MLAYFVCEMENMTAHQSARKGKGKGLNVCDQIRDAFRASGWTFYKLGREAGVKPETVARFIRRERDVRSETFAKLAGALGLTLVPMHVGRTKEK